MESVVGASTAQAGSERLDDCFERCEQIATPSGLLAGEFGFDGGEDVGQYVQVDARIKSECPALPIARLGWRCKMPRGGCAQGKPLVNATDDDKYCRIAVYRDS